MEVFDNGWDAKATLVDGRWVDRTPRRPEVEAALRREAVLLPWLAPQLPLEVPTPRVMSESPLRLRHRLIGGSPCPGRLAAHGCAVGTFLRRLHEVSTARAEALGTPQWDLVDTWPRFHLEVVPRVGPEFRAAAVQLLDRCAGAPHTALIHGDLGPDHIRVSGSVVAGVIDWTDSCIGDPALDLAWVLHGTAAEFANGVRQAYGVDDEVGERALDWHLLGPWYEVIYGLDVGKPSLVGRGLDGLVKRLSGRRRVRPA